jgi:hypothetical protein
MPNLLGGVLSSVQEIASSKCAELERRSGPKRGRRSGRRRGKGTGRGKKTGRGTVPVTGTGIAGRSRMTRVGVTTRAGVERKTDRQTDERRKLGKLGKLLTKFLTVGAVGADDMSMRNRVQTPIDQKVALLVAAEIPADRNGSPRGASVPNMMVREQVDLTIRRNQAKNQ